MNTSEPDFLYQDMPVRQFRDMHACAQIALGVVGALGLFAAFSLFYVGIMYVAAGALAATLVAMSATYLLLAGPCG